MKRPAPVEPQPPVRPADEHVRGLVYMLSVAELTELQGYIGQLRAQKLGEAKRQLIEEIRQKAADLGLGLKDLLEPEKSPSKPPVRKTAVAARPMPEDWRDQVVRLLEASEGRADPRTIAKALWPQGGGIGSAAVLSSNLQQMAAAGTLVILNKDRSRGMPPLYGLASMFEETPD